jgi:hypothetical protein
VPDVFWIVLAAVIAVYFVTALFAMQAVRPISISLAPGTPHETFPFTDWVAEYVDVDELGYLRALLTDFVGTSNEPGSLQEAEQANARKARYVQCSMAGLAVTFAGLVILALTAAIG